MSVIKKEFRSVNNKDLVAHVTGFLDEGIEELNVAWSSESHRLAFAQLADDLLLDLVDAGKIEHQKVICDRRNNPTTDMDKGLYHFEVQFRQRHCLNMTKIIYHISTCNELTKAAIDHEN